MLRNIYKLKKKLTITYTFFIYFTNQKKKKYRTYKIEKLISYIPFIPKQYNATIWFIIEIEILIRS